MVAASNVKLLERSGCRRMILEVKNPNPFAPVPTPLLATVAFVLAKPVSCGWRATRPLKNQSSPHPLLVHVLGSLSVFCVILILSLLFHLWRDFVAVFVCLGLHTLQELLCSR